MSGSGIAFRGQSISARAAARGQVLAGIAKAGSVLWSSAPPVTTRRFVVSFDGSSVTAGPTTGEVGLWFVPAVPITVTAIGRYIYAGDTSPTSDLFIAAGPVSSGLGVLVPPSQYIVGGSVANAPGWVWAPVPAATLLAGTTYFQRMNRNITGVLYGNPVTTTQLQVNSADFSSWGPSSSSTAQGALSSTVMYGPLDFQYTLGALPTQNFLLSGDNGGTLNPSASGEVGLWFDAPAGGVTVNGLGRFVPSNDASPTTQLFLYAGPAPGGNQPFPTGQIVTQSAVITNVPGQWVWGTAMSARLTGGTRYWLRFSRATAGTAFMTSGQANINVNPLFTSYGPSTYLTPTGALTSTNVMSGPVDMQFTV